MQTVDNSGFFLQPGTQLGPYTIIKVLGFGGFGVTYLAYDDAEKKRCVVKENLPRMFCDRDRVDRMVIPFPGEEMDNSYRWFLERFKEEAQTLTRLNHPNIVKAYHTFEALGTAYYVMEVVDGEELHVALSRRDDEAFALYILKSVLGALKYLHSQNILHCDIKPTNILVTEEGEPYIIDFGSSRIVQANQAQTMVKSQGYTSPEQLQEKGNVGPWSDLYGLAATMVHALTGEIPPDCYDRMEVDSYVPLANRPELNRRYSYAFLAGIDKAFSLQPENRWQTALEWLSAFDSAPKRAEAASWNKDAEGGFKVPMLFCGAAALAAVCVGAYLCMVGTGGESAAVRVAAKSPSPIRQVLAKYSAESVTAPNKDGASALHLAVQQGDEESVTVLLENGADPDFSDADGNAPLHIACKIGDVVIADILLSNGAACNVRDKMHRTPLHEACKERFSNLVQHLIAAGADVNLPDSSGCTPLLIACRNGDVQIAKILVAAGADIHAADKTGASPAVVAEGEDALAAALSSQQGLTKGDVSDQGSSAQNAANHADEATEEEAEYRQSQSRLMDPDADDGSKRALQTRLIVACKKQDWEWAESLLRESVSVINEGDKYGRTALYYACGTRAKNDSPGTSEFEKQKRCFDVVRMLLRVGAAVNQKDDNDDTPLHAACMSYNASIVNALLHENASLSLVNKRGETPLLAMLHHLYVKGQQKECGDECREVMKLLLQGGADINAQDGVGNTVMHYVAKNNDLDMARFLMSYKVRLRVRNKEGHTPYDLANRELLQLFKSQK